MCFISLLVTLLYHIHEIVLVVWVKTNVEINNVAQILVVLHFTEDF